MQPLWKNAAAQNTQKKIENATTAWCSHSTAGSTNPKACTCMLRALSPEPTEMHEEGKWDLYICWLWGNGNVLEQARGGGCTTLSVLDAAELFHKSYIRRPSSILPSLPI